VFLQADRYVEFHNQNGRHYRTRLPMYGRDFLYHQSSAELYFVGTRLFRNSQCIVGFPLTLKVRQLDFVWESRGILLVVGENFIAVMILFFLWMINLLFFFCEKLMI